MINTYYIGLDVHKEKTSVATALTRAGKSNHVTSRSGILMRETTQGFAVIGDGALVDDFDVLVQNTQGVLLIAEIETDGDEWNLCFHGSENCITALTR